MKWIKRVKVGDLLMPDPYWNETERDGSQMPEPVEILEVMEATSQSGILFSVRTKNGVYRQLDAAWFLKPNAEVTGCRQKRQGT